MATKRDLEILDFIQWFTDESGYSPSVREIGEVFGMKSSCSVHCHLVNLEKDGYIFRNPNIARAIQIRRGSDGKPLL